MASVVRPQRDEALINGLRRAHRLAAAMGWRPTDGAWIGGAGKAPANPYERKLWRLAFLAPAMQQAILNGRQPRGLTLDHLLHQPFPLAWPEQMVQLGFSEA